MDIDSVQSFEQLCTDMGIPQRLLEALRASGYRTIADLAFSLPEQHYLDAWLTAQPQELWDELQVQDTAWSPVIGRLRRTLARCQTITSGTGPAISSQDSAPATSATRNAHIAENVWAEHAPPRLTNSAVQTMKDTFAANYPGEILDGNSMPSIRLLSIVYQWFRPGNNPQWVPWQLRMSEKQYQEILVARTGKTLRTEAQLISAALIDDTPELSIDPNRLTHGWLIKIQQVFRNAIALCGGAHLAALKELDAKVLDYATANIPADLGLRTVNMTELLQADRKIWSELSAMCARGWSLDDSLHELTHIRSDLHTLLQPRPRPPKTPKGKGKGKEDKGKGKGKTSKGVRNDALKQPYAGHSTQDLATTKGDKKICLRFNKGTCNNPNCKFLHICGVKQSNGEPCGKKHAAWQHRDAPPPPST